jgi:hypothetical protein
VKWPFSSDARLFGWRIWPTRPIDTEYVERIRRQLRAGRWLRYLSAVIGLGVIITSLWAIQIFFNFLKNFGAPVGQQNAVIVAFAAAAIVGVSFGFWIGSTLHTVAMSFFGGRQERLLVDCWDALNQLLVERDAASNASLLAGHTQDHQE